MRRSPARPSTASDSETLAAVLSAVAVSVLGALSLFAHELGPRAAHMALHIAAMNVVAPVAAAIVAARLPRRVAGGGAVLWSAAAVQLVLLWAWHVPAVERIAAASHGLHALVHSSLFLSAFVFWSAVVRASGDLRWHAVAALLFTGKLTCLLSALLVFSPRALYGGGEPAGALDDQQLAGLLMITACPLSYLVAAIVIVTRLVSGATGLARSGAWRSG